MFNLIMKSLFFMLLFSTFVHAKVMFWDINGTKGGKVYLLGSIHVGDQDMYPLDKEIYTAFNEANYLILEIKKNSDSVAFMSDAMYKKGRLDSGDSLVNHLSKDTYKKLERWIDELKLPKGSMDRFQPWVAGVTLSMYDLTRLGYSPAFGIDEHFESKAKHLSKPIYGIESLQSQLNILTDDNETYQELFLKSMIATRVEDKESAQMLFSMWKDGNATYFEDNVVGTLDPFPEVKKRLLSDRNEYMYKRIIHYMNNKKGRNYFVIVGLAHLLGPDGIISKLKADGIAVERY